MPANSGILLVAADGEKGPCGAGSQDAWCDLIPVICDTLNNMIDPTEIEALKASFRGSLSTAHALAALREHVEGLDPRAEIGAADLEALRRASLAHAIASQALRGFLNTMLARRGGTAA
jgi:hypothetical protein